MSEKTGLVHAVLPTAQQRNDELYKGVKDLAVLTGLSEATLVPLLETEKIQGMRMAGSWIARESDVRAYIQERMLPQCAVLTCSNTADPRWLARDVNGRHVMICDVHLLPPQADEVALCPPDPSAQALAERIIHYSYAPTFDEVARLAQALLTALAKHTAEAAKLDDDACNDEEDPMMDKIRRYLALADQVFQIADSDAAPEIKYELIFSEYLNRTLSQIFRLDYYDPDTSCEEDVQAYVSALRDKCAELRKVVSAGEVRNT